MNATETTILDGTVQHQAIALRADPQIGSNSETIGSAGFLQRAFAQLDAAEQPLVRIVMRSSRYPMAASFGSALNWLGNGWLYLFAVAALILWQGDKGIRPAFAASLSVGIAFVFYMTIKPILARSRPRDTDPSTRLSIEPLDKYSCPSGHCMTISAIAVPLLLSFPQLQPLVFSLVLLIAWSRIVCGHHYPSDVLLGVVLGIAVSMPVCNLVL